MKSAIYPGSFDPITLGHVNLIERASKHFEEVIVLISRAEGKNYLFNFEERVELVKKSLIHVKNVKVEINEGLTADYAKLKNVPIVIRGVRNFTDFDSELSMANLNNGLNNDLETFILFSRPEYASISSKLIKEIVRSGGAVDKLLPSVVVESLNEKIQ